MIHPGTHRAAAGRRPKRQINYVLHPIQEVLGYRTATGYGVNHLESNRSQSITFDDCRCELRCGEASEGENHEQVPANVLSGNPANRQIVQVQALPVTVLQAQGVFSGFQVQAQRFTFLLRRRV